MAAENDELIGSKIGDKYRLERCIGRGGMGAVYEAVHTGIGKRVALKFLDPTAGRDAESVIRFQREAQAASAVESAHIVQIFDTGETADGRPFLVMELLRGEDLRARLRRVGRLPVPEAVHIARQVLRGLSRAHAAQIVHRDLKPENVFLCAGDDGATFVKIVDFGVSKIKRNTKPDVVTSQGTVVGTVFYMSPEQAQAVADIDGRADIYSVGAILFESLSGRPPHRGASYESVLVSICTEDAPDVRTLAPEVPASVGRAITRALSRDRNARYAAAGDFAEALDEALPASGGVPIERRARDFRRQQRIRTSVVATVAALGAFALTAVALRANRASQAAPQPLPSSAASQKPAAFAEASAPSPPSLAPSSRASVTTVSTSPDTSAAPAPAKATPGLSTKRSASRTRPSAPSAPAASGGSRGGVADGLKLNLSEP